MEKKQINRDRQKGYALILVLFISALASALIYREVQNSGTSTRANLAGENRSENYYNVEDSMGKALTWFRVNSTAMSLQFSRTNFYANFDRATTVSNGTNENATFSVPSKIRMDGTANTPMLSTSATIGTSTFPVGTDTQTGAAVNPATMFAAASFGSNKLRFTLIDAIASDPSKDYGDAPAAPPDTDFNPVYRIDVMTDTTRGAHLFGYLVGSMVYDYGAGFFGKDFLDFRQSCDSYLSNNGDYSNASKRANCSLGSEGPISIHGTTDVYGSARTKGAFTTDPPYGGDVCDDFIGGCPNPGETCSGATCSVPTLPSYSTWSTYCPAGATQGNLNVAGNAASPTVITVAGTASTEKCWDTVTLGSNKYLRLTTTNYAYFIDTLDLANNANISFNPSPGAGTINLYVRKFVGDKFNGNQVLNTNNKPYQLRIHYLGTDPLTLNGTAAMHSFLDAPYAAVNIQGNFTYKGGIKAKSLTATGSGALHYDESGDVTTISDMSYQLKTLHERYR